jgi:hypothetical protein
MYIFSNLSVRYCRKSLVHIVNFSIFNDIKLRQKTCGDKRAHSVVCRGKRISLQFSGSHLLLYTDSPCFEGNDSMSYRRLYIFPEIAGGHGTEKFLFIAVL